MVEEYKDGDYIYDTQWLAMKRAIHGDAIFSGLAPTAPGGMVSRLGTGSYYAGATKVTVASTVDFTHSTADLNYDRWDLIWGTSAAQGKLEGTPGLIVVPPDLPAGAIILYMVRVRAGTASILTGDLYGFGFTSSLLEHASQHMGGTDPITPAGIGAEPAFSKNTAFNKNFGINAGDIAEIATSLGVSGIVETDSSGKLITATKGTAYNKSFGTGTANVPQIGATLGNSHNLETNASGQLITASKATAFNQAFEANTNNIKMNGTVSVGALSTIARSDHIHPVDTSRAPTSHAINGSTYGWGTAEVHGHLKVGMGLSVLNGQVALATHDHAYHAARTRRFHAFTATELVHRSGNVLTLAAWPADANRQALFLPHSVNEGYGYVAGGTIPFDYDEGNNLQAIVFYAPATTTANNWKPEISLRLLNTGTLKNIQFTGTVAAGTAGVVNVATLSGNSTGLAGIPFQISCGRFGSAIEDDYPDTIYLLAVVIAYTADM